MEGTIAQILLFAGNFSPKNWAFCQGQILAISSNTALFSLIGTTYGGNGTVTFGLPDMSGRVPVGIGQGPGLTPVVLGQKFGVEDTTLTTSNLPAHNHAVTVTALVSENEASDDSPVGNVLALNAQSIYSTQAVNGSMAPGVLTLSPSGLGTPVNIAKPYLGMNFVICLFGVYPIRP